jgi:hypothetical protein
MPRNLVCATGSPRYGQIARKRWGLNTLCHLIPQREQGNAPERLSIPIPRVCWGFATRSPVAAGSAPVPNSGVYTTDSPREVVV